MSAPDPKLVPWLRKHLRELTATGTIERVELYHAADGTPIQRLLVSRVDEGVDADELGQELWDAAQQDSSTRPPEMAQRYVVATFQEDEPAPLAQFPFLMPGGTPGILTTVDQATEKGERGQMMRHNETLHRLVVEQNTYHTNMLRNELESERKLRTGYEKGMMEMFETMQQLMDRRHEREMETKREESKARRHEELMGLLMAAAPLVLAQVVGGKGLPGAAVARDEGIRSFLKSLDEKEINGIIGSLKPEHAMVLMEVYKSYASEEKKRNPLLTEAAEKETKN